MNLSNSIYSQLSHTIDSWVFSDTHMCPACHLWSLCRDHHIQILDVAHPIENFMATYSTFILIGSGPPSKCIDLHSYWGLYYFVFSIFYNSVILLEDLLLLFRHFCTWLIILSRDKQKKSAPNIWNHKSQ